MNKKEKNYVLTNKGAKNISIIKTKDTHYYKFDWDCPTENYKKVYLAIRGKLSSNPSLDLFSTSGVGYNWQVGKNHTFKNISAKAFQKKATLKNIVYFMGKDRKYNVLLNYPGDYQKQIDICLLKEGYNPSHKVSLKEQLKNLKNKINTKEINKQLRASIKEVR